MDLHTDIAEAQQMIQRELPFPVAGTGAEAWQAALAEAVNHLIVHDFHRLAAVLYQLDVPEKKLRQVLSGYPGSDAGEMIALLMVERQLQKIKTRQQFSRNGDNIPDSDRW